MVQRMGWGPVTFTVVDTLAMVAEGILPEDASVELLNGALVYRDRFDLTGGEVVAGVQHDYVVMAISKLAARIDGTGRHLRSQTTLVCAERHAPIPDAMVLRGAMRDYSSRYPTAADAFCVVEVADSSYERDAGEKLQGYARAGVAQYVIINLRNRTAEVYSRPDTAAGTYSPPQIVTEAETLVLRVGEGELFDVRLADVLP
jgi:hypothetical protein